MKKLLALTLAAVVAGCAGQQAKERPPRAQQVIELGQQGQAAYVKGELPRAGHLFEQALGKAMQIEDSEGVGLMSINLARVARESNGSARALGILEAVSPWHRSKLSPRTAQELNLLAAVLLSDLARHREAHAILQGLRDQCQSSCDLAIGIDSLQARLLLEQGDAGIAAEMAMAAIARFRDTTNRLELANLLRLRGEACLALGDFPAALQSLEDALGVDKMLGQPTKIALDLEALARAALAAGDAGAHAGYLARLKEVRQGRNAITAESGSR